MRGRLLFLPGGDPLPEGWAERLARALPGLDIVKATDADAASAVLDSGCAAAFGTLTPGLLVHATELRWLQAPAAAPSSGYFFPELAAHPVTVTNLRGTYVDHVAAHAVAMLLALCRNLHLYVRQQISHEWLPHRGAEDVIPLDGATVAIVGFGAVGSAIASLLRPFGCTLLGVDAREVRSAPEQVVGPERLDDVIVAADVVIVTVPHTPQTEGLIGVTRLASMKRGAVLINIGRGAVVDIDALADTLAAGAIRAAALDVFPEEPLASDHRLWREERVLLTPHVASVGPFTDDRRFAVLRENAARFFSGRDLLNVVDKTTWY